MGINDQHWMAKAYALAIQAQNQGEVPVGALIVSADGEVLGRGWNQVIQNKDPCAHAEIMAIREAAARIGNYRILNSTLYVTLEPCPMCAGAMIHARIQRLVFGTRDFKAGAAGSVYNLLKGYPLNHQIQIDEGIMQGDCAELLSHFFENRR